MTETALIDGILEREGGYQESPKDGGNAHGGATNWGITSTNWGRYRGMGRSATREEVRAITRDQAVAFYRAQYVAASPFLGITYEPLRVQCIDFAVNSGSALATRWLQRVLRVPVTSVVDDRTKTALLNQDGFLVNEALVGARARMVVGAVGDGTIDTSEKDGLLARAVSFSEIHV